MTIVVTVGDKAVVGEMARLDAGEIGHISEMVTEAAKLDTFCAGWGAKGAALAEASKDESPEFPVVRVEEGWSRSRRLWTADVIESIAEQTNRLAPVGHLGHIDDDKVATAFPDPQTTWFGAITKIEPSKQEDRKGEMVKAIYLAGYNLPGAKIRGYIKANAVRGISWWGDGEQVPIPGKGIQVKGFRLRALDWARKLAEGMPTSGVVAIASEMEGTTVGDKALSQVTPEEFKQENPNGYALLVAQAVAEKDTKIGEMETDLQAAKVETDKLAEIRKLLKVKDGEDILAAIAAVMSKLGDKARETLDAALDKVLAEKVPDEAQRKLVRRLLPVGEMESKLADANGEDAAKLVGEMVTSAFDKDDMIKEIVSEMSPPVIRKREELRGGQDDSQGKTNPYINRERVTLS
jgi:hypothetical protein